MLSMYSEGLSALEAACAWMKDPGKEAWRKWIPPPPETATIRLAVLIDFTGSWHAGSKIAGAAALAVERVNADETLLAGRVLEFDWADAGCSAKKGLVAIGELMGGASNIAAVIGPGCRQTTHQLQHMNVSDLSDFFGMQRCM